MADRDDISRRLRDHYEAVWRAGDAWGLEASGYERDRLAFLLSVISDRRYERALEVGCGSGQLTRLLAGVAGRVVAFDVAPAAVERARAATADAGPGAVDLRVADALAFDPDADGPWDLVVLCETVYSLGWLYPFFDVAFLAARLFAATRRGGRLLLSNTYGQEGKDWLLQPWLVDTYRDLFRNVGYRAAREEQFTGTKDGVTFRVPTTVFEKPLHPAPPPDPP